MLLVVGRIVRPHGIRGEVVVDVRTDEPEQRFAPGSVLITDPGAGRTLTIDTARPHLGRWLIVFDGVDDRALADDLRGVELWVDSADLPPNADPDEFNDHQLVGLAVVGVDGQDHGQVVRIDHAPASDLLVVKLTDGRTGLVPFVKAIVVEVDLAGGRVVLDPPEGLFDL